MPKKNIKVAIVHDFLTEYGGAERVTKLLSEMYPDAPIYTLLYDERVMGEHFPAKRVRTSYLQKWPGFLTGRRNLLVRMYPRAVESFDLSGFDVVLSSSNGFAHGVVTNLDTKHIVYYHSPMRHIWDWYNEYMVENDFSKFKRFVLKWFFHKVRIWDQVASRRADISLANSENVRDRIQKYYRKDSEVVYPPVDIDRFKPVSKTDDYFLIVSKLSPHKRIDLAIKFFNKVGKRLIIAGSGKDEARLKNLAAENIEFLGQVSDADVASLMAKCRGFVFPGEEDFGITPVEAMASGRPVLAFGHGGVIESVIDKKTGIFFKNPDLESFETGLAKFLSFERKMFDSKDSVKRAKEFSDKKFVKKIREIVEGAVEL